MVDEEFAKILSDIAGLVVHDAGPDAEGVFLYAEGEPGVISPSLFKDGGDRIFSYYPSNDLSDRLFDAWQAAPDDRKWGAIFLTIQGDQFDARFQYPDEWIPGEDSSDRRQRVLLAKFGNKPIDESHFPLEQRF